MVEFIYRIIKENLKQYYEYFCYPNNISFTKRKSYKKRVIKKLILQYYLFKALENILKMEVHGRNPWMVEDLDDFYFLCCPECAYKSKDDEAFMDHAVENHPKSKESSVFSEAEQELSRQKTFQKRDPPKCNNPLAEVKLAKQTKEQKLAQNIKKVVKVISAPKNIDLIDMPKEGVAEESHTVELEDPDDYGALESINEESIDRKLIIIIQNYFI